MDKIKYLTFTIITATIADIGNAYDFITAHTLNRTNVRNITWDGETFTGYYQFYSNISRLESTDGISWRSIRQFSDSQITPRMGIFSTNSRYFLLGWRARIFSGNNVSDLNLQSLPSVSGVGYQHQWVHYGGGTWIIFGSNEYSPSGGYVLKSENGLDFNYISIPGSTNMYGMSAMRSVFFDGKHYFAGTNRTYPSPNKALIFSTSNFSNWDKVEIPYAGYVTVTAYDGKLVVTNGSDVYTLSGTTLSAKKHSFSKECLHVAIADDRIFFFCRDGVLYESTDLTSFSSHTIQGLSGFSPMAAASDGNTVVSQWYSYGQQNPIITFQVKTPIDPPVLQEPQIHYLSEKRYIMAADFQEGGENWEVQFDWGDGTESDWGEGSQAEHEWFFPGQYSIRARIRRLNAPDNPSPWSAPVTVTIDWNVNEGQLILSNDTCKIFVVSSESSPPNDELEEYVSDQIMLMTHPAGWGLAIAKELVPGTKVLDVMGFIAAGINQLQGRYVKLMDFTGLEGDVPAGTPLAIGILASLEDADTTFPDTVELLWNHETVFKLEAPLVQQYLLPGYSYLILPNNMIDTSVDWSQWNFTGSLEGNYRIEALARSDYSDNGLITLTRYDSEDRWDNDVNGATLLGSTGSGIHGPHSLNPGAANYPNTPDDTEDWFELGLQGGQEYRIWAKGLGGIQCTIYSEQGAVLNGPTSTGGDTYPLLDLTFTPPTDGWYQFKIENTADNHSVYFLGWESTTETGSFSGSFDAGGGKKWSEWFGWYNDQNWPWIWDYQHNCFLWVVDNGSENLWFWHEGQQKWMWTRKDWYPWVWFPDDPGLTWRSF